MFFAEVSKARIRSPAVDHPNDKDEEEENNLVKCKCAVENET
jgi:hypothetical protein